MRDPDERALRGRLWRSTWLLAFLVFAAFLLGYVIFPPTGGDARRALGPPALTPGLVLRVLLYFVLLGASAIVAVRLHLREAGPARATRERDRRLRPSAPPDCPFCRGGIAPADLAAGVVRCPTCEVAHHGECWKEHGGCATLACGRSPQERERARERVGGA
jgi:hypothetical protein